MIELAAAVFEVGGLQQTAPEHDIQIAVIIEIGENRAGRMAGQIQTVQRRLFRKRSVAVVVQQHVGSDPHRDVDIVKAIAIDIRNGDTLLLVRGDRCKIGVRQ